MFWADEQIRVQEQLAFIEPELIMIHERAWARLKAIKGFFIFQRSRPTVFHDFVTQEALCSLGKHPAIKNFEQFDSYFFVINQEVALRFKKGNAIGLSSNYPTNRAQSIQRGQIDLPGIRPQIPAEVVYQTNSLWTELKGVLIVRRYGNTMLWQYPARHEILPAAMPLPAAARHGGDKVVKLPARLKKTGEDSK